MERKKVRMKVNRKKVSMMMLVHQYSKTNASFVKKLLTTLTTRPITCIQNISSNILIMKLIGTVQEQLVPLKIVIIIPNIEQTF